MDARRMLEDFWNAANNPQKVSANVLVDSDVSVIDVGGSQVIRIDDTPAHRALREALANCLTNANWYERRGVVCLWEEDAIRIANPGDFRVDIASALRGGESDPRNENLLKMFSYIDVGERAGSGLPKIVEGWSGVRLPRPVLRGVFRPRPHHAHAAAGSRGRFVRFRQF